MQLLVGVDGLGCIKQVFHELSAQIHIHLLKCAFAVHEPLEMLVYVLPLDILAVSQSFDPHSRCPDRLLRYRKILYKKQEM